MVHPRFDDCGVQVVGPILDLHSLMQQATNNGGCLLHVENPPTTGGRLQPVLMRPTPGYLSKLGGGGGGGGGGSWGGPAVGGGGGGSSRGLGGGSCRGSGGGGVGQGSGGSPAKGEGGGG